MRSDDVNPEFQPLLEEGDQSSEMEALALQPSAPKRDESKFDPAEVLPADVFHLVMDRLPFTSLAASAQVNRKWRKFAARDNRWEAEFERIFPITYRFDKNNNLLDPVRKKAFRKEYLSKIKYLTPIQKKLFRYCLTDNLKGVISLLSSLKLNDFTRRHLVYASEFESIRILNFLYEKMVLPAYYAQPHDFPLLYWAVAAQQPYAQILDIIVKSTGPLLEADAALLLACANGDEERARLLLEKAGADINVSVRDHEWWVTPVHQAIRSGAKGTLGVVNLLIDLGANLLLREGLSGEGFTPLHTACLGGDEDVVLALLNAKVPVDILTFDGGTPLYMASQCGHAKIVAHLLAAGAQVDRIVLRRLDKTSLGVASRNGHSEVVRLLIKAGASGNLNALHKAIQESHSSVVKILAPLVLKKIMKTQLEESQNISTKHVARFIGFFGVKRDCHSIYQAAFALQEYIHGRLEKKVLIKHRSTMIWDEDLTAIFQYYSKHPEIIEVTPQNIPDTVRNYFSPGLTIAEKEKLAEKIHSICQEEKMNMGAYLALALIRMGELENTEETLLRGQSKFESAFIWLKSIDPSFTQVRQYLENWVSKIIIPKNIASLFLQKIGDFSDVPSNTESGVNGKGKEEEDENLSDLVSLSR